MAKTPSSQCRGPQFEPWSGNKILQAEIQHSQEIKINIKKKRERETEERERD